MPNIKIFESIQSLNYIYCDKKVYHVGDLAVFPDGYVYKSQHNNNVGNNIDMNHYTCLHWKRLSSTANKVVTKPGEIINISDLLIDQLYTLK